MQWFIYVLCMSCFPRGFANDVIVGYCVNLFDIWNFFRKWKWFSAFLTLLLFPLVQLGPYRMQITLVARCLAWIFFHLFLQLAAKVSSRSQFHDCLTLRKQLQIFEYMPEWQIDIITELHFFLCFSHVVWNQQLDVDYSGRSYSLVGLLCQCVRIAYQVK